ncbi:MAG: aldehyde ferredoxin oxidoreductase [Chloroflexi bacterium HGW-Chloroflexi-6]|nr:MAG: aldehyde ferredoxin oxidoreductase [Chloroflexi bacterium HGW-Chloroflexi-6]
MQIWRINVRTQTLTKEPVPAGWEKLGGRGLLARIMLDEVPPTCEPLGPRNKLIFAPGLLVGHMISSTDRISIGGKSPLTGGIKEANAGGRTGMHMAMMGIKALIVEDFPLGKDLWVLHLSLEGAKWQKAEGLTGLGVYDSAKELVRRYGEKVAISLIGPGGEMKMLSAGIQNIDKDRIPSRIAARGGLGAVMASKGLKAIVFDNAGGQKPPIQNLEAFRRAQKDFTAALMNHPQTALYRDYGTQAMPQMTQGFGALPTRNFSQGTFEQVETISGEHMRDLLLKRGGESDPTHACMAGCTIRCSNVFGGEDGKSIVSPLEYETVGLMGSNLGIGDLDVIARLNWQANDLGLDTIELGAALGVAADSGVFAFGDGDAALKLMDEIRAGTPLGRLLGAGAGLVGKVYGNERVPVVKNQAMSAYEPRAIKGTGVTYATTPQGADHTCGLTIRAKVNHLDPLGQAKVSLPAQLNMAGYDTLGACIFAGFGFATAPTSIPELIKARYGWDAPADYLQVLGRETIKMEREWNKQAGFTKKDDRLPEYMTREPLPPNNPVFDVSEEELDTIYDDL